MSAAATPLTGQIWRYGAVGLVNTGFGLALIAALHLGLGLGLTASNAAGYLCGWLISYQLNRRWTFRHRGAVRRSLVAYGALVLVAFGISLSLVAGALAQGLPYLPAQAAGVCLYSAIVFFGARHVVFASH
ncbi:GtrA family protein [Citreicella sp. C3M06]|uniref:GtrA family protein n=1 Tax=Roseobacteraceae TaxID=2854170 RepID=UPI001C09A607|nr:MULTISPECIES: GtrA family protein [Roseobacteraceae]MBU2961376.1 GtrA family protein [Citreicella sp. C3M06]MDO6584721.1 GtrA family protein [Salipiger sp. 1_MG-2023]